MSRLIDIITGERKTLEKSYLKLYGKRDYSNEIEKMKRKRLNKYILFGAFFAAILMSAVIYETFFSGGGIYITTGKEITIDRPADGESAIKVPMLLEASWGESETLKRNVMILVRPEETDEETEQEASVEDDRQPEVDLQIGRLVKMINKSNTGNSIILPKEIDGGINLIWGEKRNSRIPLIFALAIIAAVIIYQGRFSQIKKMEETARESIIRELPEFINRLVLLLNAGLVLTSAFARITESFGSDGKEVKSYFYSQLIQIGRSMRETNGSMAYELKEFAARSGVRELMRIAGIVSDNIDKGSGLVEKLRGESDLLWLTKKKMAEEKGRLSETKLTFPLVMLLLVLIMVTIAPALMEM